PLDREDVVVLRPAILAVGEVLLGLADPRAGLGQAGAVVPVQEAGDATLRVLVTEVLDDVDLVALGVGRVAGLGEEPEAAVLTAGLVHLHAGGGEAVLEVGLALGADVAVEAVGEATLDLAVGA